MGNISRRPNNAELLNKYFGSVFTQEDISNTPEPKVCSKKIAKKTSRAKGDTKEGIGEIGKVESRQKPRGTIFTQNCYTNAHTLTFNAKMFELVSLQTSFSTSLTEVGDSETLS